MEHVYNPTEMSLQGAFSQDGHGAFCQVIVLQVAVTGLTGLKVPQGVMPSLQSESSGCRDVPPVVSDKSMTPQFLQS